MIVGKIRAACDQAEARLRNLEQSKGSRLIWIGILLGIGGTVAMDLWALIIARLGIAPFPNWAGPGRWVAHWPRVFHADFQALAVSPFDPALGWMLHYGVGVLYGVIWIAIGGSSWLATPSFLPVWLFSLLTIAAGWFLLQPAMGLGWAASQTPSPWKTRILGLLAHTAFGFGMWATAMAVA